MALDRLNTYAAGKEETDGIGQRRGKKIAIPDWHIAESRVILLPIARTLVAQYTYCALQK